MASIRKKPNGKYEAQVRIKGLRPISRTFSTKKLATQFVREVEGNSELARKLGVPGEELPKVMYRLVDAESYSSKRSLIVGGGDSAVEAAIGLAKQTDNEVALSYRKEKLFRIKKKNQEKIEALFDRGKVTPIFSSNLREIREDAVELELDRGEIVERRNDFVFVFAGGVPPFRFLNQIGVQFGGEEACPTG